VDGTEHQEEEAMSTVDTAYACLGRYVGKQVTLVNDQVPEVTVTGYLDKLEVGISDMDVFFEVYVPDEHGEGDAYRTDEWTVTVAAS
jgi:hypothetical protein